MSTAIARAQHGGMGHGGPMGGMGGDRGGMGFPGSNTVPRGGPPPGSGDAPRSGMRGGLQLAPPGRWWNDKKLAKSLGLNGDQQKRMDTVFTANRDMLVSRYETLQRAEARLETLAHTDKPSESALFAEIDHVAQARADLEKVNTHYLLQLRDEMTPDQISKLDEHR